MVAPQEPSKPYWVELQDRSAWTPVMIYIHRTRLIAGMILGFIMGLTIGVLL